jgi:hypothetical protein
LRLLGRKGEGKSYRRRTGVLPQGARTDIRCALAPSLLERGRRLTRSHLLTTVLFRRAMTFKVPLCSRNKPFYFLQIFCVTSHMRFRTTGRQWLGIAGRSKSKQRKTSITMAEFSCLDRALKVVLGPALGCAWWNFAPDYRTFFSTPIGQLTLSDIAVALGWLLLLLPLFYATISWLYEAWTGRDSVWFWHPD